MKFRTEVIVPEADFSIAHQDRIMMIGSCFVENMSQKMIDAGFHLDVNPFGILYNPLSINNALHDLTTRKEFVEADIFFHSGVYQSFSHHGRFSGVDKRKVLYGMNERLIKSRNFLQQASCLIVTLGTSKVYRLSSNGHVVANCHKLPANYFVHNFLSLNEIVEAWHQCIQSIRRINPHIRILFTVSPIRHWKDGAIENQLSKSLLFLAINEISKWNPMVHYFPSYEIMMDDLRDYRFYADDMLHPSSQAIEYIWKKFSDTYFSNGTKALIKEWQSIQQALNHRPLTPDSEEYKLFLVKTQERERKFLSEHPEINTQQIN